MKRILKWGGIVLGGILIVVGITAFTLYMIGRSRVNRTYEIELEPVAVRDTPAAVRRGEHVVKAISACEECHGEGLRGEAFFSEPMVGTVVSANLTRGEGGVADQYTDEDWQRAIRHAIGPNGQPLLGMPSNRFIHMDAEDLAATIAYLISAPPVDHEPPETQLAPLAYFLFTLGQLDPLIPAEQIDHDAPIPDAPSEGATQAYGRYLVNISTCRDCHGEELSGGQAGPGVPIGPNLTPAGDLSEWSQEDFFRLMREGQRPMGRQIIDYMPWSFYQDMSDVELEAIWLYLQSLEPRETPAEFAGGRP